MGTNRLIWGDESARGRISQGVKRQRGKKTDTGGPFYDQPVPMSVPIDTLRYVTSAHVTGVK